MDWAKHRRRKAVAKMHPRLDLHSVLPSFAIVDTAGQHDNKRACEVCATKGSGFIMSRLLSGCEYIKPELIIIS
jgi:hypothetical protein